MEEEKNLEEEIKEAGSGTACEDSEAAGECGAAGKQCGGEAAGTENPDKDSQAGNSDKDSQTENTGADTKGADSEQTETAEADKDAKSGRKDSRDAQIQELKDKFTRQMAEFDNFRKRTEKEKSAMYEVGARSVIEKILPIVDNFERGLGSISDEERQTPFADGMDKVYKQLAKALDDMDVKPIEALGKEFDPEYHNAVMHVDDEEAGENIIVEEFQKGYTYRDTVVRHSMVKVAN